MAADRHADFSFSGLIVSVFSLFLSAMFVLSSLGPAIVTESLISTDMVSNTRYGVTFPALNSLENQDEDSVIAIGSSIIQASVDGKCISESLETDAVNVYNLGISGANPYTEILQIPALIRAEPELVLLDLGPNGLWDFKSDSNLEEYIQFRFTINSIAMQHEDIGNWTDLIREEDRKWIAFTEAERIKLTQSYSQKSFELWMQSEFSTHLDSIKFDQKAPLPGDEDWIEYLMQPSWPAPNFELKTQEEVMKYFEEKMPRKATQGVYNPKLNDTLNHKSYEYIISELTNAGIEVLLVATPHHPMVYSYLEDGQLDNFNETFERYSSYEGVKGVNMFWEEWHDSMFRDRNHLGINGREYFCQRLAPIIDGVLEGDRISDIDSNIGAINLTNYLEDSCNGNDFTTIVDEQYKFIQAESYSNCVSGEGIAFQDRWKFESSSDNKGSGFLHALPEDSSQYKKEIAGSRLDYQLEFSTEGSYYVWINMKGNSYGNDSIGISWKLQGQEYLPIEKYESFGWSSKGQWEWEPEFNREPMIINASANDDVTLSIWMTEDGVMIDEILITTDSNLKPKTIDPHQLINQPLNCEGSDSIWQAQFDGEVTIEAEEYSRCSFGEGESIAHQWIIVEDINSSQGAYLAAMPDERVHMKEERGPGLHYDIYFPSSGTYYVWISMRGNSYGNDTVGLNWNFNETDGNMSVIASFAWNSYGQWEWEPQTSQVPLNISVSGGDLATLSVWMREDGVEFDRLIITNDVSFDPYQED